jgi:hypothetical protein
MEIHEITIESFLNTNSPFDFKMPSIIQPFFEMKGPFAPIKCLGAQDDSLWPGRDVAIEGRTVSDTILSQYSHEVARQNYGAFSITSR